MISDFFLTIVTNILFFFHGLFPLSAGFSPAFHSAIQYIGGYLYVLDPIVPTSILLSAVSLIISVEILLWSFRFFRWVFSHIPFVGGHS